MKDKIIVFVFIIIVPFVTFALQKGDVDGKNGVDKNDYVLVRKHILKSKLLTGDSLKRADFNGKNGIDNLDYVLIRKKILENTSTIPVKKITLNKTNVGLEKGKSITLLASISPEDATDKKIIWTSSNTKVATVNSKGKVVGVSNGTAIITAKSNDGSKSAKCTVNVITITNYNIENDAIKSFMSESNLEKQYKDNKCDSIRCDIPANYHSTLSGTVELYKYSIGSNKKSYITAVDIGLVNYYFIPNNIYYIKSTTSNKEEYVRINGTMRMIKIPNMRNIRDLGGWKANNGTIKYGLIFRGSNPDDMKSFVPFTILKIKKMIDLRRSSELSDKWLPEIKSIVLQLSIAGYEPNEGDKVRNVIKTIMENVVSGKHLYFNCYGGRDRTGTIAYLLEGMLGVSIDNRYKDYELSYFDSRVTGLTHTYQSFKYLVNEIKKYDKNNDELSFVKWYLDTSKNKTSDIKLINDFRKKMINGNPLEIQIKDGKIVIGN